MSLAIQVAIYGNRVANMILNTADLVISVGARLSLRQIGNMPEYFAPNAKLIRADIDQYELSRFIKSDEEKYLKDAKEFLEELILEDIPKYTEWHKACFKAKKILEKIDIVEGNLCMAKLSTMLPANPIIAVDVGQNQCWSAQSLELKGHGGRLLIGGGYGSMGCGLPYAIGASIATNNGVVYCVTGDGGLQMNIQELQTVVREKLPIKILVLNNHALGKISEVQAVSYEGRFAQTTAESGYTVPNFANIARAYGIKSDTLKTYKDLDEYKSWMKDDSPCLIDISLSDDTKLIPKVNWNEKEIKPAIDETIERKVLYILNK
ncbi:MAG: thiamine pyrophosphate-dependent enzyme [Clostridiales bacterium]|nr:thiamine pyrophosphate-dependent enzyme [Clostridiales bacterium]